MKEWNERDLSNQEYPFLLVDALVIRVRKDGWVRLSSVLLATGIHREGYREVLELMIGDSESEATWSKFFDRLKARGLKGWTWWSPMTIKGLQGELHGAGCG